MSAKSKNAATGALSDTASGVFGKAAGKLFRLPKVNGRNVHYIKPTGDVKDAAKKYKLPENKTGKPRPHVNSKKIPKGSTDLAKATQEARRATGDKSGKNFAAYRYIDKNGEERILVGRSEGTHSERSAGGFLLDEMKKGNIKEIKECYTERAPCAPPKGHCEEWLYAHIQDANPNFKVSHSWNYDGTDGSNAVVSSSIRKYASAFVK